MYAANKSKAWEMSFLTSMNSRLGVRRHRINDLLSFLTLADSLAQRFFESHHGLRDADDLLAKKS